VRRAVGAALGDARIEAGEIGIVLADDARIQALNKNFRGADMATNVLAFPAPKSPGHGAAPIGDIVLAYETMAREAEAEGKTAEHHLMHLAVHGTLHLLGFDHVDEAEAERMETLERRALASLGIADPYAERSEIRTTEVSP